MATDWEPVRQLRTHELVLERIEQQVMSGELRCGDRLPPERKLAEALGVSRSAVREALRIMEAFGLLVSHTGRGPDAGAIITTGATDAVGRMLRLHLTLGRYELDEILETRVLLERTTVAEIALDARSDDLEDAARILKAMDDPALTANEFNELDTRFHVSLAHCSGNELTCTLTAAVRESIRPLILEGLERVPDWRTIAATLQAQHRDILHLIRERQPERAARAVELHIRGFHGKLSAAQDAQEPSTTSAPASAAASQERRNGTAVAYARGG